MSIVNDTIKLIKEFKPALLFLLKFLGMYVILSIFYGIYVESFGTNPDLVTIWVSEQTSGILQWFNLDTSIYPRENVPKVAPEPGSTIRGYLRGVFRSVHERGNVFQGRAVPPIAGGDVAERRRPRLPRDFDAGRVHYGDGDCR